MRNPNSKIKSLDRLLPIVSKLRRTGKKVVLSHGIFDLMHFGHLHYLHQAKKMGDVLVVSILKDKFVQIWKGPGRPVFNEKTRMASIASLECVDFVVPCLEAGPYEIIKKIKPEIYAKGEDSKKQLKNPESGLNKDIKLVKAGGGEFRFTKSLPIHSSELINNRLNLKKKNKKN